VGVAVALGRELAVPVQERLVPQKVHLLMWDGSSIHTTEEVTYPREAELDLRAARSLDGDL
jgi:hypothetical protein